MSWSTYATGKVERVRDKVAANISGTKCVEPEETVKNEAGALIDKVLASMPAGTAVKVEASGSQYISSNPDGSPNNGAFNRLQILVEPIPGFLE